MDETGLIDADLRLAGRLDARFFALLEAIETTGSINRAARTAGYSYKGAWLLLEMGGNLAREPLVTRFTGGKGGGGSRLTPAALGLLDVWRHLQAARQTFLRQQEDWLEQQPAWAGLLRRLAMKTTARNQFAGTIAAVEHGPVTTQVSVTISGGQELVATMTSAAAARLRIEPGAEVIALIKSSAVVLVTDFAGYSLSARNQLAGSVSRIDRGAVTSLVVLTLPGGAHLTASVTNDAVDALPLTVGASATGVFKAYSVMLAVAT